MCFLTAKAIATIADVRLKNAKIQTPSMRNAVGTNAQAAQRVKKKNKDKSKGRLENKNMTNSTDIYINSILRICRKSKVMQKWCQRRRKIWLNKKSEYGIMGTNKILGEEKWN